MYAISSVIHMYLSKYYHFFWAKFAYFSLKCVFWKITKIVSSFSKKLSYSFQIWMAKIWPQIRIFDFHLYCPDFCQIWSIFGQKWQKSGQLTKFGKNLGNKVKIKNPYLWPSGKFFYEQLSPNLKLIA